MGFPFAPPSHHLSILLTNHPIVRLTNDFSNELVIRTNESISFPFDLEYCIMYTTHVNFYLTGHHYYLLTYPFHYGDSMQLTNGPVRQTKIIFVFLI